MKQAPQQKPSSTAPNVKDILKILRKRWAPIVFGLIVGTGVVVGLELLVAPKYDSTAQLLVMRKDPRLATGAQAGSEGEVKVTEEILATHMQLLQSRKMVGATLNNSGLIDLPSIVDNLRSSQAPVDFVIDNLAVSRGGTGQSKAAHVLNIRYRSASETDAATVLTELIKTYQEFLATKFQDVNEEAASLIFKAQTDLARQLDEAEKAYEGFRTSSSSLMWRSGADTTNVHRVQYDLILQEIANLQMARAEAAARLDSVDDRLKGRDPAELTDLERLSLVDDKNLTRVGLILMVQKGETESPGFQAEMPIRQAHAAAELEKLAELQLKEATLMVELGPQHPELSTLRDQISIFKDMLAKQKEELKSGRSSMVSDPPALFDAYCKLLQNDISAMDRREARLKVLADDTEKLASELVTDEIQADALRRDVERKQELYNEAVDRLRAINLAKDYSGFINEVVAEPEVGKKVVPSLKTSIPIGGLLAIVIALAGIGLAEYRDRRFRTTDDLQQFLHLPVLGRIPFVGRGRWKRSAMMLDPGASKAARKGQLIDPNSPVADAFRVLRTYFAFADEQNFRQIIGVTSPCPGDGKSTTTANLAISLGQLGRRVLVIDVDLRRPSQHGMFSISNDEGLTSVIGEGLDAADLIVPTQYNNVSLLPRGQAVSNPAEFLATGEFTRLLESLRDKYDHILLDCPPVLHVVETVLSASFADGVILVLQIEKTTQFEAHSTCASLRQAGAQLEGVVINALRPGSLNDDSYNSLGYNYYYSASYGYDEEKENGSTKRERSAGKDSADRVNGAVEESAPHIKTGTSEHVAIETGWTRLIASGDSEQRETNTR